MYFIISYENASEEQNTEKLVSISLISKFSMPLRTSQTDTTMLRCLQTIQAAVFYRSVGSPALAKHMFLGVI
jgi:hypothetical protein